MRYLSGVTNAALRAVAVQYDIGFMASPNGGSTTRLAEFPYWAADNGCYSRGERFVMDEWLTWLRGFERQRERCLFAVAPDVYDQGRETWARSRDVMPLLREIGYQAALVMQPGIDDVLDDWDSFDVAFTGGGDDWKVSDRHLALLAEAKRRGKSVHWGRVNSYQRLVAARGYGADTADGTFLAFGPDKNLPQLLSWIDRLRQQPGLDLWSVA